VCYWSPDALRWRGICCGDVAVCVSVWLSVCLSVTLTCCAQTTESIIMRPSPDCSPAILVFPHQIWTRQLEGLEEKMRPINRSYCSEGSSGRFVSNSWVYCWIMCWSQCVMRWVLWMGYRSSTSTRRRCRLSFIPSRVQLLTTSSSCPPRHRRSVSSVRVSCGALHGRVSDAQSVAWRHTRSARTFSTPTAYNVSLLTYLLSSPRVYRLAQKTAHFHLLDVKLI